jgi:hypothetical protein
MAQRQAPPLIRAAFATLLLVPGLLLPLFRVDASVAADPVLGPVVNMLFGAFFNLAGGTYSIIGGITSLWKEGSGGLLLGSLLFLVSVALPVAKIACMWSAMVRGGGRRALAVMHGLAKWSMAEIIIVSLMAIATKGMPGASRILVEPGFIAYLAHVILAKLCLPLVIQASQRWRETLPGRGARFAPIWRLPRQRSSLSLLILMLSWLGAGLWLVPSCVLERDPLDEISNTIIGINNPRWVAEFCVTSGIWLAGFGLVTWLTSQFTKSNRLAAAIRWRLDMRRMSKPLG